jgi:hypothetical protein
MAMSSALKKPRIANEETREEWSSGTEIYASDMQEQDRRGRKTGFVAMFIAEAESIPSRAAKKTRGKAQNP